MADDFPRDLDNRELDELDELLAAAPAPLQPLGLMLLDGYLAGVLVQPRLVPVEAWLPPALDDAQHTLPPDLDPVWLARTRALVVRRRDAINAQISEHGAFDPLIPAEEEGPPISEYESPLSPYLLAWAAGFQSAQQNFPELEANADETVTAALDRIYRHLPARTEEQRAQVAAIDRARPLKDLDAAIADVVAATVELWDATAKQRFAVPTLRRDTPKIGRNDPCPCGSGKKYKACHGK